MGEALGKIANLLNASLRNHEGADDGSRMYGSPTAPAAADDPGQQPLLVHVGRSGPVGLWRYP